MSKAEVKALPVPDRGVRVHYDAEFPGFGVRVTSGGKKSWVLNYYCRGRERRITIGSCADWSPQAARDEAKRLRRMADVGEDPMAQRESDRGAPTVSDLAKLFKEEEIPTKRPSTRAQYEDHLDRFILPRLGRMRLHEVARADAEALHRSVSRLHTANRVLGTMSALFSFAVRRDMRRDNPCTGVRRHHEPPRERYLNADELGRLSKALDALPPEGRDAGNVIRLLLLTGARRGEVLRAKWEHFDLEAGTWTKPASSTKQGRSHRVPLSAPALNLLRRMKPLAKGPWVFSGKDPDRPRTDLRRWWPRIRDAAGLEGVRVHDLRHTFASLIASSGGSLPMIGALLGHSQPSTTARYAHLMEDPLREAADGVGRIFAEAEERARDQE